MQLGSPIIRPTKMIEYVSHKMKISNGNTLKVRYGYVAPLCGGSVTDLHAMILQDFNLYIIIIY